MLLDIHTHRNAAVPGECIFNVEPAWFEPVDSVAKRGVCPTNFIERVSRKTVGYSLCEGV